MKVEVEPAVVEELTAFRKIVHSNHELTALVEIVIQKIRKQ